MDHSSYSNGMTTSTTTSTTLHHNENPSPNGQHPPSSSTPPPPVPNSTTVPRFHRRYDRRCVSTSNMLLESALTVRRYMDDSSLPSPTLSRQRITHIPALTGGGADVAAGIPPQQQQQQQSSFTFPIQHHSSSSSNLTEHSMVSGDLLTMSRRSLTNESQPQQPFQTLENDKKRSIDDCCDNLDHMSIMTDENTHNHRFVRQRTSLGNSFNSSEDAFMREEEEDGD
mmetsp:Transcript_16470/g.24447  ORF Transcript_16470/g.24447 Transcript_16470/m.24447 type:complete len:226 (-) Transcript_16470:51-728(-)